MRASTLSSNPLTKIMRWIARIMSLFVVGMVLVIFIGERGFNPMKLTALEAIMMVFFWTTCLGLIIAWRWEFAGGLMATGGMLAFYYVSLMKTGLFPKGAFPILALPGVLFVLCWLLERHKSRQPQVESNSVL